MPRRDVIEQKWVVLNDTQIPFEDKLVLWELVVAFVRELKPYGVVLNGDIVDHHELSDFDKDPKLRHADLRAERKGLGRLMAALAPATGDLLGWLQADPLARFTSRGTQ